VRTRLKIDAGGWWHEQPRRAPAAYACALVAANVLARDERLFVESSPDIDEIAEDLLRLEVELAHALVLVLETLPDAERDEFARKFYAARTRRSASRLERAEDRVRVAATAGELVLDLASQSVRSDRIRDLLVAVAQGDDLSVTPEPAVAELQRNLVAARREVVSADPFDMSTAATLAVIETLDPASGDVALQEVLLRATWAALRSRSRTDVLAYLHAVDDAFRRSAPA
jgi:hypothetical protein